MGKTKLIRFTPAAGVLGALLLMALAQWTGAIGVASAAYDKPVYGFAMYGEPALPADFKHLPYANPNAPKGGTLRLYALGGFDSFNPFSIKGEAADGLVASALNPTAVFETLAINSGDEPFTMYGLIAETITVPKDRSWVTFTLRKEARFHDGSPITSEDVIFSFDVLLEKGLPLFRNYYAGVAKVEKTGPRSVTFRFVSADQKELPLILGELPVLSKSYWEKRDLSQGTVEPPLGSGPYKVSKFEIGKTITYERVKDYWGKDLPVNAGRYNFDTVKIDYFNIDDAAFEGFKAGQYDLRYEQSAKKWATGYDFPAIKRHDVVKELVRVNRTNGMQGFYFNTRHEIFKDRRVRQALANAFDFEWTNEFLAHSAYTHSRSYFNNSDLESKGIPKGRELELLEPLRGSIPAEVFTHEYNPPSTVHRTIRDNLRDAQQLLETAGWTRSKDGKLVNAAGRQFSFEILMVVSPDFERLILPMVENLRLLGIDARVRPVDSAQYVNRVNSFDYDIIIQSVGQSDSPGNEQRNYWGSKAADTEGSRNFAGVKDPAIDQLIEGLVLADTREDLVAHVHAIDRILQYGYYAIPMWYLPAARIAYWKKLKHPERWPAQGPDFSAWWVDPAVSASGSQRAVP